MATRSRLLLATLFTLSVAACSSSDDLNSGGVIPTAQAVETARSLYPALAADAEADGHVYEYH